MRDPAPRRLLGLMRPYARQMTLAAALAALTILSSVGLMFTSSWMIAKAGLQPSIAELGVSVVLVRAFGIFRAAFRYAERITGHDAAFRLLADLRVRFYEAVEPLAPARLSHWNSGDLNHRVIADVEALQNVYLRAAAPALSALLVTVAVTLFLMLVDFTAGLVAGGFLLTAGIGVPLIVWRLGELPGRQVQAERALIQDRMADYVLGMADALAYGYADAQQTALYAMLNRIETAERRAARGDSLASALHVALTSGALVAVLAVTVGRVDGLLLAALALGTAAAFEAFIPLAAAAHQWSASMQSAARLFEMLDAAPVTPFVTYDAPEGSEIVFDDVIFGYDDSLPVLDGFSLDVPQGTHITLTAPSGAGKSTLVNLLAGLWQPDSGSIRIGGRDLRDLAPEDVRARLGVMTQRVDLFNTSARENIRLARPDATDAEVEHAARQAQLGGWIDAQPDGLDVMIGENGLLLSGGERQRLALARVFLRDAPVWVLDEPTAHLDTVTADAVMSAVRDAAHDRTLIILQHEAGMNAVPLAAIAKSLSHRETEKQRELV